MPSRAQKGIKNIAGDLLRKLKPAAIAERSSQRRDQSCSQYPSKGSKESVINAVARASW
jgi:hypothetical protein